MSDDVNVLSGDIEQYRYDARGRLIEISHAGQVAFNCTYRNEGGGEGDENNTTPMSTFSTSKGQSILRAYTARINAPL